MKGIYVDDQPREARIISQRLMSDGVSIDVMEPSEDLLALATSIADARPDFVLLDYRLDQFIVSGSNTSVGYRAAPLAQQLRDRTDEPSTAEFPIVLISSEDKIRKLFRPEKTAHDLFDWKLIKTKVGDAERSPSVILGLSRGYSHLKSLEGNFRDLSVFGLVEEQEFLVDHQELQHALEQAEYVHVAARYLLTFVIKRQGILLDRRNLYARLGISSASEGIAEIEALFDAERYDGVFSECRDLWWTELFEARFREYFQVSTNMISASDRAARLSEKVGVLVTGAADTWDGSKGFYPSFACACCGEPTALNHSVACFDSRLPSFVQRLRVCYRCVQQDKIQEERGAHEDDHHLQVDAKELIIADMLRSHQLVPGEA
ncbi:hypothetical protein [Stenotrophomonas maltophilia]|uniref:hypothetical protein n=1 Tax=Stenotrophomonas maltophilia TaxID=40324 RepID=UPI0021C922DC|nr:hypothetical protein [Stenotrophomonas maltophilia]MCU1082921.1 hypothetical protein [Stenotrophomonas maltophilia]